MTKLSYHFEEGIIRAQLCGQLKTIGAMEALLGNYEQEGYYRSSGRKYDRPNTNRGDQNRDQRQCVNYVRGGDSSNNNHFNNNNTHNNNHTNNQNRNNHNHYSNNNNNNQYIKQEGGVLITVGIIGITTDIMKRGGTHLGVEVAKITLQEIQK